MNMLASQRAEVKHQGKWRQNQQWKGSNGTLTKKPRKSAGGWGKEREIEDEIREESWTVVRWFAAVGYGSSCKEEKRLPASAESERRTERVCKKWWGECPNTNSQIWSTMGRCKDMRIRWNDPGVCKSEAWMAVKMLWMAVFLFHFILLYFIP